MQLIWIDWLMFVVVGISAVISIKRGFVKEALSLLGWVVALVVSRMFVDELSSLLVNVIESPQWRVGLSFTVLFGGTLVCFALFNHLVNEFIRMTGLSGLDRVLGMIFGILRGLILVVVVLSIGRIFALDDIWANSQLVPYFDPIIEMAGQLVKDLTANPETIKQF
ncbi:CvpA family protein [Marinicellulosiphila megalodicopiae]|uniref:CvpA family protein n=1 Tax=Marinicellulosiphila megalodicopiae TaxID=2724896 RepID=UPI003BB13C82